MKLFSTRQPKQSREMVDFLQQMVAGYDRNGEASALPHVIHKSRSKCFPEQNKRVKIKNIKLLEEPWRIYIQTTLSQKKLES